MIFRQDQNLQYLSVHNPLFGLTCEQMIGQTDRNLFPETFASEIDRLKQTAIESKQPQCRRLVLPTDDDELRIVDVTISSINAEGNVSAGLIGSMLDLTGFERREDQLHDLTTGLAEFATRLNIALDGSTITIFEQDTDLRYTFMHNSPPGTSVEDFLGKSDKYLFDKDNQASLFEAKSTLLRTGEPVSFNTDLKMAAETRSYDVKLEPKKNTGGEVTGLIGVAVDMTERKRQEEHWRLVMREMTHRSKNLLAVIQAMARQTAARSESTDVFVKHFAHRLRAMSKSHDLLVNENWQGVDLTKLVEIHLTQVIDIDTAQISIHGDDIALDSSSAQNLGLALHELMTNAVKYGSLSVPEGRLSVSWNVKGEMLCLHWIETGGPTVVPSERSGFGRNLLESAIGASLDGAVDLQFKPDGLVCEITIPSNHFAALST